MTVEEISAALFELAPRHLAEEWDNVGLLVGEAKSEVCKVLVSLDVDEGVAREAAEAGAQMIVCHHPVIFRPENTLTGQTPQGRTLLALAQNRISVFSAHTNLDNAPGGLTDVFAKTLGLAVEGVIEPFEGGGGCGRVCKADTTLASLAARCGARFGLPALRYAGEGDKKVRRVALCNGGGKSLLKYLPDLGVDAYISGDIGYNDVLDLVNQGIGYIEIGHYNAEIACCGLFAGYLKSRFPSLEIVASRANKDVFTVYKTD